MNAQTQFVSPAGVRPDRARQSVAADRRVAALIPAFNEEPVIEGTIDALLVAGCSAEDIYVVDDRSTDRTAALARARGVHVYTVPANGGKARAQVAGLEHFHLLDRYGWVMFLDGDTKVDRNFLAEIANQIETGAPVSLYVGQVKSVPNTHLFSALRAMEYAFGHDLIKQGQSNCNVILVSPGCASVYRTSLLRDLHIDHSTLAEDMDLTVQAHRLNKPVCYLPSAIVYTQDPSTFKDYYKQVKRWYRGFWQVVQKHRFFSPLQKKQWIDWYVMFLIADWVFFNKYVVLALLLIVAPDRIGLAFIADSALGLVVASYAAIRTRRPDVFYKFPIYYWIAYVNYIAFLLAMVEILVLRKTKLNWNKVKRYDFDCHKSPVKIN